MARQFHSPERIEWVKSQPCEVTKNTGIIHNAHMKSRGAGGTWHDIVPLDYRVHGDFDTMPEEKFFKKYYRTKSSVKNASWYYVRLWQIHLEEGDIRVCNTIGESNEVP